MKNLFVPLDLAIKLKEIKFNEPCVGIYTPRPYPGKYTLCLPDSNTLFVSEFINNVWDQTSGVQVFDDIILAPLYQQVFAWLLTQLDFYYPNMCLEIYSDDSGTWHYEGYYEGNPPLAKIFDTLDEGIEIGLELLKLK